VDIYVGKVWHSTMAALSRPDVAAAFGISSAAHGFRLRLPVPAGTQPVCVYAIGIHPTMHTGLGCRAVSGPSRPVGVVDSVSKVVAGSATVSGWAFDPNNPALSTRVDVYVGSAFFSTPARLLRPDVASVFALPSAAHGFRLKVRVPPGSSQLCVYAIALATTKHSNLGCRTATS
jgi:hypothetical protein